MNLFTGESSDAYFGGDVPASIRPLLERAAAAPREEVGSLLWTARALAPTVLPIYYALYKHHAGRREFDQAHAAATRGLLEAARQAGLDTDWRRVTPQTVPAGVDFQQNGPARFWLFTLKALAFIALRRQLPDEAAELLAQIARLDTGGARVGDEVIARLLASLG
ncbi:hypothetical protein [Pelomonas cellulosilytica]|uniref:Uncharacterized protein n=1 Tax=Pelomonas cellulosilytica TaxID=2906762 RepID=A0ABS8XZS4_9BURK|nr:hypothetical protein [Pelomonas sp. P8]MCE4556750.1 hypothetical protein [Pelomonas sp. P8]